MSRTSGTLVNLQGGHSTFLNDVSVSLLIARLAAAKDAEEFADFCNQERPVFIDPNAVVSLISFS